MRTFGTMSLLGIAAISIMALQGCSSLFTAHTVDADRLAKINNRKTKVGEIVVPCTSVGKGNGTLSKKDQISTLNNIDPDEVLKVLHDAYGLNVVYRPEFELKSSLYHFMGLVSESYGRCFYYKNNDMTPDDNVVTIGYGLMEVCTLFCDGYLRYNVSVKSEGEDVIIHKGEITPFDDTNIFDFRGLVSTLVDHAKDIPGVLQRDIEKTKSQKSP